MTAPRKLAILGAAGGIGRVLTSMAAKTGWQVVALDLATSLADQDLTGAVERIELDLRQPETVQAAFTRIGPLDGFVNLAGFMSPIKPVAQTSVDDFDDVIGGNLRGAFLAAQAALPQLQAHRGSMVNVVSGLAAHARPGFGPYAAAKAGIVSLTKTLALEAAPDVRVNAVGPSALDTAFLSGGTGRPATAKAPIDLTAMAAATPLRRIATAKDVAGPVLFLLSDAAAFMTGQVLWVNGGGYMP